MNWKKILNYTLTLGVTLLLLWVSFKGVKWSDFIEGLKSCNIRWILASMVVSILPTVFRGLRWRLQMLPINNKINRLECYDTYAFSYLVNMLLPRAGEFVRCGILAKKGKISFESSVGTMVAERSIDVLSLIILFLAMVLFSRFGGFLVDQMWLPLVNSLSYNIIWILAIIVIIGVALLIYLWKNFGRLCEKYSFWRKVKSLWDGMVEGFVTIFKMKHKWAFLIYTILIWLSYWLMSYFTILAFPEAKGMDMMDALFLMIVGSFGWAIPVQGGFGAYHFLVSMTLVPIYGIEQSKGLIFATISHESQIVTMVLCGLLSMVSLYFQLRSVKKSKEETQEVK